MTEVSYVTVPLKKKCPHRWVNSRGQWYCKDCMVKGRAEWSFVFNVWVVMPIGDTMTLAELKLC